MRTNLKKKALLPLVAMVLVSVISLTGVTYAWFTTSNTASVENLQVNVQVANGIQISLNAKDWSSRFVANDITDSNVAYNGNKNQVPNDMIYPVSTNGSTTDGLMNMYLGNLNADNTLDITKLSDAAGTSGNYIAFDLFFNMDATTTVTLDKTVSAISDPSNKGSDNCARVAFVQYEGAFTTDGDAIAAVTAKTPIIWEPNGKDASYMGLKAEGNDVATVKGYVTDTNYAASVTTVEKAEDVSFTFNAGINKVRVYIWMEGQDINCVNGASGGQIAATLQFTK